ncbi:MAG: putative DNA binding domain-containing protein [Erysipelotrichaceae bacterium]|nr:putative DNA binding domain-containing protein [Erysipelotrichaceae bacterium]
MNRREGETIEFKKSTSELKQGVISLASMLNRRGEGTLYFGILNSGEIVGQPIGEKTTRDISREIRNYLKPTVLPAIEILQQGERQYIRVTVSGSEKPYSAYGRYYVRSDDEDLIMDNDTLYAAFRENELDYSRWENTLTEYSVTEVDEERVIRYFNEANACGRISYVYRDLEEALQKLKLLREGKLTNAGYYLFSKNRPLKLKLAVFNTDERISFSYVDLFEGNILECIEAGRQFVSRYMNWSADIVGMKRVEVPEIPLEAVREIIVNSFAHMKYHDCQAINNMIYFTPTKLRIINAGGLPQGVRPEDFAEGRKAPLLRNPLIGMTLYKNGTIDSFATGFEKTFRLCRTRRISYEYADNGTDFSFTFIRNPGPAAEAADDYISERRDNLLRIIEKDGRCTRETLAARTGLSSATVARELKALQQLGLLERRGSNKNGFWVVIRK